MLQAIDDCDITCQMPTEVAPGEPTDIVQVRTALTHAQLSSEITRAITALKCSTPTLTDLLNTIDELNAKLQAWWDSVPAFIRDCKYNLPGAAAKLPAGTRLQQVIYQHYAHYGSLLAIQSLTVHPWHKILVPTDPAERAKFNNLVASSTAIRIKATRQFIQMLPQLDMNMASPKWCVYPVTAFCHGWQHECRRLIYCPGSGLSFNTHSQH